MDNIFDDRNYAIFDTSELNLVDFNQVLEDSINTIRMSIDLSKVVIKWVGSTPEFINDLTTLVGIYNHSKILIIMSSSEWQADIL